jgi:hypothetical protein
MKTLSVPFHKGGFMKDTGESHRIDVVNWNEFSYRPKVSFQIAYDEDNLYLRYEVKEDCVRARATENNGHVWLDSCVEFFLSPEGDDEYYNLECNCIGTKLLGYRKPGVQPEHASDEIINNIRVCSSLGNEPFEEKTGDFSWFLEMEIPWESFWKYRVSELEGKTMRANFYKCGDELSKPHFLSWNPIHTERPSFHQPRFFGELRF